MSVKIINRELRFSEDIIETTLNETTKKTTTTTTVNETAATVVSSPSSSSNSRTMDKRRSSSLFKQKPKTREVGTETEGSRRAIARRLSRSFSLVSPSSSTTPMPPPPLINPRSRKFRRMMSLVKWKRSQSNESSVMNVRQEFSTRILKPNDYFFFSVFTSLFCFLPIGLISIYFSIKSVISFHAYRFSDAIYYSNLSYKTNIVAFSIGFFFFVISMIIYLHLAYGVVFNDYLS